jgi:hypothetical protein
MVMVLVAPLLPRVTDAGWNDAVAPGGRPVADRVTALVKEPLEGCTAMVYWAAPPRVTVCGVVGELVVKSATAGAAPVPLTVTACGEPLALSATLIDALKLAAEAGVKVTLMVQVAPAARVAEQLEVSAKSAVFAPVRVTPDIDKVAVPGFDRVNVWTALVTPTVVLGKESVDGVKTACGVGAGVPVPVRVEACGEPVALSVTVIAAVKLAADTGVKVTLMVQVELAASDEVQVVDAVLAKSAGLAPVTVMLEIDKEALPGFDSVKV